ncbi:hypothetical protein McanMca71_007855 [Microsporum canis]|uniref:Uncharacterized protein n=1 Tax=Arthroderma otae (strain ATCC MYA-4605 / CBS 113480) TaxID=554155 RepID=C5FN58_ARTOC|nr:conserved hypothetical protein [Microsporum canis CBS 113480]EEQ31294.1 conserved hypothetical protein [Microsporum canis CBS 113480]
MASDSAYAAFLDKANEGLTDGKTESRKTDKAAGDSAFIESKRLDVEEDKIPSALRIDAFYSSETDEPFEPVVLACDHWPSEEEFSRLVHGARPTQVSVLSASQFDRHGQYARVLEAVQMASQDDSTSDGDGQARVYRVQHDETRCEYWLLTRTNTSLVGLKARAVES